LVGVPVRLQIKANLGPLQAEEKDELRRTGEIKEVGQARAFVQRRRRISAVAVPWGWRLHRACRAWRRPPATC
jgi:hypothetical protein